jgi:hypothetical protein
MSVTTESARAGGAIVTDLQTTSARRVEATEAVVLTPAFGFGSSTSPRAPPTAATIGANLAPPTAERASNASL